MLLKKSITTPIFGVFFLIFAVKILVWKFRCYFRCENFGVFFWCCEISLVLKFQRELAWAFSIEKHQKTTKIFTPKITPKFIKKHQKSTPNFLTPKKNFNTKKIFTTPKKTPNLVLTPKCSEKTTRIYHHKKNPASWRLSKNSFFKK